MPISLYTPRVISRYILYEIYLELSFIVNSDIFRHIHVLFRHIQLHCDIFRTCMTICFFDIFLKILYDGMETTFYEKKESSLVECYRIGSNLTVF